MSDESAQVRAEDAFDVAALATWLRAHADSKFVDRLHGEPNVRQFPGGASNLTYRLKFSDLSLILRRPPVGTKASGAHDMGREYRIQKALKPLFDRVPEMVAFADAPSVIGEEFYVMTELQGLIPRRELPFELTPQATAGMCENAFAVLVQLHRVPVADTELSALGKGSGYVARQVRGWTTRLSNVPTDDLGDWAPITDWLSANQPADVANCLIHNDFRLDNLVFAEPTANHPVPDVVGVLDWEMATLGDPLMDLGGALAYWVEEEDDEFFRMFRRQPSNAPGMWTRAQIVEWYCAQMGFEMPPQRWRFYEVFGLFRLAVIAQQIWYRYANGQTSNEAYAVFGPAVGYLEQRCRTLLANEVG